MNKQNITVEVDIPDGYEYLNTDIYRNSTLVRDNSINYGIKIFLKKKFVWPDWLGGYALVRDRKNTRDNLWNICDSRPIWGDSNDKWIIQCHSEKLPSYININLPDVYGPESLIINPRYL